MADSWDEMPEDMRNVYLYGLCLHCGSPRCAVVRRDDAGQVVETGIGCSNPECDPRLILIR